MRLSWQSVWRAGKVLLTLVVIVCVGWQFAHILLADELWRANFLLRPAWMIAAGLLYFVSLAFTALYWYRLLRVLGQHPTVWGVLRSYYVGQLSRYVPGKVVGVVVRAGLLSGPEVSKGMAALTIVYEALTTLLSGAALAIVLLPLGDAELGNRRWLFLGLLVLVGIPLLPGVFNRLVGRVSRRFPEGHVAPAAPLKGSTLAQGFVLTAITWGIQGASLWALLQGMLPQPQPWSWVTWAHYTGYVAVATTVGFLIVALPGGLGMRELLLQHFLRVSLASALGNEQAAVTSVVAVLLLRLVWITVELVSAGVCYWLPGEISLRARRPAS
jgi:uncharacterized membrane protein YbhN (UPF0104 family)